MLQNRLPLLSCGWLSTCTVLSRTNLCVKVIYISLQPNAFLCYIYYDVVSKAYAFLKAFWYITGMVLNRQDSQRKLSPVIFLLPSLSKREQQHCDRKAQTNACTNSQWNMYLWQDKCYTCRTATVLNTVNIWTKVLVSEGWIPHYNCTIRTPLMASIVKFRIF